MEIAGIATIIVTLFAQMGLAGGLLVIIVVALLYYIPRAFKAYIVASDRAHDKFSKNLEIISGKFVSSLNKITEKQDKHYDKLEEIHNDVKKINKK